MKEIQTKLITSSKLPLVVEPTNRDIPLTEFLSLLQKENGYFKQELLKHGGLLFRNFPIRNEHDFVAVMKSMQTGDFIQYVGGDSPRTKILEGVYTSTETPPSMTLPLHNELSYFKHYPSHIYFYCDIAPIDRGETIVGDARKIFAEVNPDVRERFIEKDLRYISRYPSKNDPMHRMVKNHKSWVHVFETEDKREVERKCRENEIDFLWNKNDWIEISQKRPAVIEHPITGEKIWFNQAHHYDFNPRFLGLGRYLGAKLFYCRKHTLLHEIFFGDSSKIPRSDLYHILDVMEDNTIYFSWQRGDVLVLDNILAMHGRAPFSGKRRVLTAMTG